MPPNCFRTSPYFQCRFPISMGFSCPPATSSSCLCQGSNPQGAVPGRESSILLPSNNGRVSMGYLRNSASFDSKCEREVRRGWFFVRGSLNISLGRGVSYLYLLWNDSASDAMAKRGIQRAWQSRQSHGLGAVPLLHWAWLG
jgi:hypothetical protein